jgi:hypothetical protein
MSALRRRRGAAGADAPPAPLGGAVGATPAHPAHAHSPVRGGAHGGAHGGGATADADALLRERFHDHLGTQVLLGNMVRACAVARGRLRTRARARAAAAPKNRTTARRIPLPHARALTRKRARTTTKTGTDRLFYECPCWRRRASRRAPAPQRRHRRPGAHLRARGGVQSAVRGARARGCGVAFFLRFFAAACAVGAAAAAE